MNPGADHTGGLPAPPLPTVPYDRDRALLDRVLADGLPRARVYPWDMPAVVIGRGGDQERELFTRAVSADGIPLLKRRGGGCSVVLDPGNVIVAVGLPLPGVGLITRAFAAISSWLTAALADCGIPGVQQEGVSDLVLADRKIGGSCVYRTRGLLYYSTTLLVAPDLDLVERYLRFPPREPDYRRGRSHRDFMGALHPHLWPGSSAELAKTLEPLLHGSLENLSARLGHQAS